MKQFHYALITAAFAALLLSACGSADTDTAGSSGDNSLVVLNYGKYLDASAIKMFEQETGIKIKPEEYESPEEMYTKFSAGSISYDVVCTSDYMVERLCRAYIAVAQLPGLPSRLGKKLHRGRVIVHIPSFPSDCLGSLPFRESIASSGKNYSRKNAKRNCIFENPCYNEDTLLHTL